MSGYFTFDAGSEISRRYLRQAKETIQPTIIFLDSDVDGIYDAVRLFECIGG